MEVISHASNVLKDDGIVTEQKLEDAIETIATKIEVDLNLTKDGNFICVHDQYIEGKKVSESNLKELKRKNGNILTIEEVLEIVKNYKELLLDVKTYSKDKLEIFRKLKEVLCKIQTPVSIESTDIALIDSLKFYFPTTESFIIANAFSNQSKILSSQAFQKCDGLSLSSENFFFPFKYKEYKKHLNDNQKIYAWTWNKIYPETECLFNLYQKKECDGIITDEVYKLERWLNK